MEALDSWFADNAHRINLQVRIFNNPTLVRYGISDVEVKFTIEGKEYFGRGTSLDIELALRKSCSEAVERFFLIKNAISTSNGFSVHLNRSLAARAAKNEIIERDLFLCHFLTQKPFNRISIDNPWINRIVYDLQDDSADIKFYSMGSINSIEGILCSINGQKFKECFGSILGTAAGNRSQAVEAAFFEAIRNYSHLNMKQSLSIEQFENKSKVRVDFMDHGNLALNPEYSRLALEKIINSDSCTSLNENFDLKESVNFFNTAESPFTGVPLEVCHVKSPCLQDLYVGVTHDRHLNNDRLIRFSDAYKIPYETTKYPHPFN